MSVEYSSGLPFPPPGDLPDSGIKPTCPASPEVAACSQDVYLEYKKQMNQKMSKQTMEVKC